VTIENLSYYQTIDAEKYFAEIERAAKAMSKAVNNLYDLLHDTEYADYLNELANSVEDDSLSALADAYDDVIGRQGAIEEEQIEEERAARREGLLVIA
jgi:hypothetical protein